MGGTSRDYIAEALGLQTDEERLAWFADLSNSEYAEVQEQMRQMVAAIERRLKELTTVLNLAVKAKTYGEFKEMLPLARSVIGD